MDNKEFQLQHDLTQTRERITSYIKTIADMTLEVKSLKKAVKEEREAAMAAILNGCTSDGSDTEIILRRAWDRVRTMSSNVL